MRKLRVFLCHATEDKPAVRTLYASLKSVPWIDPWLDEENLLPGQDWDLEIYKATRDADAIIICLSSVSVKKEGYVNKEIRRALDIAQEKPEGTIYIIPLRLDDCTPSFEQLKKLHWVNYFTPNAHERLLKSLYLRADKIGVKLQKNKEWSTIKTPISSLKNETIKSVGKTDKSKQENPESEKIPRRQNKGNSIARWLFSCIIHISILLFGFIVSDLIGILFISLPLFLAYYFTLYRLAIVLLPTSSNSEDQAEIWKRFSILVSYTWGVQFPLFVIGENAWEKIEPRIPGSIPWNNFGSGLIWTRSHQVVAITEGTSFSRIVGPGVIFTSKLEQPEQVFDLRMQLRTKEIEVVSKDGIRFIARYFTAFRIDKEDWSKQLYDKIRPLNPRLRGADKLSYTKGSFPFSHKRVQATLGITSTNVSEGAPLLLWDQWVMNVIEDQTRKIISQKTLDDMWRPANDYKFANAMDVIASELKQNSELILRAAGILLVTARVVNFKFPFTDGQNDEIAQQQINMWGSEWERKRQSILVEADAESERLQQEARAYAQHYQLRSITDDLQVIKERYPNLSNKEIVAIRYLILLRDYIRWMPEEKNIQEWQKTFREWQEQFFLNPFEER